MNTISISTRASLVNDAERLCSFFKLDASALLTCDLSKIRIAPRQFSPSEFEVLCQAELICYDTETGIAFETCDSWSAKLTKCGVARLEEYAKLRGSTQMHPDFLV